MNKHPLLFLILLFALFFSPAWEIGQCQEGPSPVLEIDQLSSGKKHHLFGYIGQSLTIPWNESGRYLLGLEIDSIHRMPLPGEAATIVLFDTHQKNKIIRIDRTYAWNPQQGSMFYWNPHAPESQFFFNDVDLKTGACFTVLFDVEENRRIREYRYSDSPVANGGVAPEGRYWLGLNYGRLSRLRPVTGYPAARDWSASEPAPCRDGIFRVDIQGGEKQLLVSYRHLDEVLREAYPGLMHDGLFINHTLWNRTGQCIYFFVRAGWNGQDFPRINVPFSMKADGSDLTLHELHIGGHPEWAEDELLIGRQKSDQVLYDVKSKKIAGLMGSPGLFPDPEGDVSLSPDGSWFVNGYKKGTENHYLFFRRSDSLLIQSPAFDKGEFAGDIRIDPAPRWNRESNAILVPGMDQNHTRQLFIIRLKE